MLALLVKVVRRMVVFTLGKRPLSNKPGKFTSYYSQGSDQGLGGKSKGRIHSILVTEGQQEACGLNLLRAAAPSKAGSRTRLRTTVALSAPDPGREPEKTGSLRAEKSRLGRNSGNTLALTEKDTRDVWRPLQIWNNVNDFPELSVQLHWVIWNLWFMN